MHFGLSTTGQYPADMPALYAMCLRSLRSRDLTLLNHFVHDANDSAPSAGTSRQVPFSDYEDSWRLAVLSGQPKLMTEAVQEWISAIRKNGSLTPEQLERWDREIERFANRLIHEALHLRAESLLKTYQEEQGTLVQPSPDRYICSLTEWQHYWEQSMHMLASVLQSQKQTGSDLMHDVTSFIDQNYQNEVSLYDIAARFHVSREYISRKFKQKHGINIPEYINRIRITKAKVLLQNPDMKVTAISELVGFKNDKYFSLVFKKQEGISPKEFRKLHI